MATTPQPNSTNTNFVNGLESSKLLNIPNLAIPDIAGLKQGALNYFTSVSKLATWNGTTWVYLQSETNADGKFVPLTRNLTINGVTQDLSIDRIFTIPTITVDAVPTLGSTNAVSSGGTYDYFQTKANYIDVAENFTKHTNVSNLMSKGVDSAIGYVVDVNGNVTFLGGNYRYKSFTNIIKPLTQYVFDGNVRQQGVRISFRDINNNVLGFISPATQVSSPDGNIFQIYTSSPFYFTTPANCVTLLINTVMVDGYDPTPTLSLTEGTYNIDFYKQTSNWVSSIYHWLGDSMTFLNVLQADVQSKLKQTNFLNGISASLITPNFEFVVGDGIRRPSFVERAKNSMLYGNDMNIIYGGFNDFGYNAPLGLITDIISPTFDTQGKIIPSSVVGATFYGSLKYVIQYFLANFPSKPLRIITPHYNSNVNISTYSIQESYTEAIINLARTYNIPVLDMFHGSGINSITAGAYTSDGLHFSALGGLLASQKVSDFLNNNIGETTYPLSQKPLTITTNGSGAATLVGSTLNIPTPNLAPYELIANKQNSLSVDPTNTKYPTVTTVILGLLGKANLIGGNTFSNDQIFNQRVILPDYVELGGGNNANTGGDNSYITLQTRNPSVGAGARFTLRITPDPIQPANLNITYPLSNGRLALESQIPSLAPYELTANKQNSLAVDVTNLKYPTVTAVNQGLLLKANLDGGNTFTSTSDQLVPLAAVKAKGLYFVSNNLEYASLASIVGRATYLQTSGGLSLTSRLISNPATIFQATVAASCDQTTNITLFLPTLGGTLARIEDFANYVDRSTTQSVGGQKTFTVSTYSADFFANRYLGGRALYLPISTTDTEIGVTDSANKLYALPNDAYGVNVNGLRFKMPTTQSNGTQGFCSDLEFTATANRRYTFPDASITIASTANITSAINSNNVTYPVAIGGDRLGDVLARGNISALGATFGGKLNVGTSVVNPASGQLTLSGSASQLIMESTSATTNNKLWDVIASNVNTLSFRAVNDANTAATNWLNVTRNGITITLVEFNNSIVRLGFSPVNINDAANKGYVDALMPANYTASGNGSSTTIVIPHLKSSITSASKAIPAARNSASAGWSYYTIDATNITLYYSAAPVSGTNNLNYSILINP